MKVTKVVNNNVILAADDSSPAGTEPTELVLMGKGLGFGAKAGDEVDPARVERTFGLVEGQTPERIATFLDEIPAEHIAVTEEIVEAGRMALGEHVGRHMLLPLADHISFAIRRAGEGVTIAYPLRGEVLQFYPEEVSFSRRAIAMVQQRLGVVLPDVEAIPFALHFVNAQFNSSDIRQVVELTEAFSAVLSEIGSFFGIALDEDSLEVARFITHLRYLVKRQERRCRRTDGLVRLLETFRQSNPRELDCAERVGQVLRERFGWVVDDDEALYLALHISRLAGAVAP